MSDRNPSTVPAPRPKSDKPVAAAAATEEPAKKEGWLGWTLGWIIAPLSVLGAIFGGGVLLGAHSPDNWFARAILWMVGLFS